MRANANATILNKGTAIENPKLKRSSICLLTNELLLPVGFGCGGATLFPEFRRWVGSHQVIVTGLLNSNKSAEKLWDTWVLSASVCGTGSFSVHTATHSISRSTHEAQSFLLIYGNRKNVNEHLMQPPCIFPFFQV